MSDPEATSSYRSIEGLRVEQVGPVLELEIDRPAKRNALTDPIVQAMIAALSAAGPDESVRVVLLQGAGEHFCAGFDIVGRNAGRRAAPGREHPAAPGHRGAPAD